MNKQGVLKMEECLTFDDVQLVPQYSEVRSRGDVDTSSKLDDETVLRMPLIASPMDSYFSSYFGFNRKFDTLVILIWLF